MRWHAGPRPQKWHRWYAWYPVMLWHTTDNTEWVWLEWVERKLSGYGESWYYRLIEGQL